MRSSARPYDRPGSAPSRRRAVSLERASAPARRRASAWACARPAYRCQRPDAPAYPSTFAPAYLRRWGWPCSILPSPTESGGGEEQAVRPIRPTAATSRADRTLRIKPRGPKTGDPNPYSRPTWVQVSIPGPSPRLTSTDRPQIGLITPRRPVCLRTGPRARPLRGPQKGPSGRS